MKAVVYNGRRDVSVTNVRRSSRGWRSGAAGTAAMTATQPAYHKATGAESSNTPALCVADLPWKRSPTSLAGEGLFHLVYGAGAGAALRALRSVAEHDVRSTSVPRASSHVVRRAVARPR